jgi:hypothetical protein
MEDSGRAGKPQRRFKEKGKARMRHVADTGTLSTGHPDWSASHALACHRNSDCKRLAHYKLVRRLRTHGDHKVKNIVRKGWVAMFDNLQWPLF